MKCPSCGSNDLVRAGAMHEQSSGSVSALTSAVGIGIPGPAFGVAIAKTAGTTNTILAQRLTPPTPRKGSSLPLFVLGAALLVAVLVSQPGDLPARISAICILACGVGAAVWLGRADAASAATDYASRMKTYAGLWYCRRCGSVDQREVFDSDVIVPANDRPKETKAG